MEAIMLTNDMNNYSVSELNYLRESIENMNKFHQIEVLRILNNYKDVTLNENKYGIHVNISDIKKEILDKLSIYVNYVNTQETTLNVVEKVKEDYINKYFTPVHIHGNNACSLENKPWLTENLPMCMEVTFMRNDLIKGSTLDTDDYPDTEFDKDNNPDLPSMKLNWSAI